MSETLSELRQKLTDDELIKRHDAIAKSTMVGTQHYLDELARRDAQRTADAMLRLTKIITALTIVMAVLTVVNVGLVLWLALR